MPKSNIAGIFGGNVSRETNVKNPAGKDDMVKTKEKFIYDVIVVGGGFAGCEGALASARNNVRTLLLTINMDTVAFMPFGNELGGFGKDLLIREIDFQSGEILKNIKKNCINVREEKNPEDPATGTIKILVDSKRYSLSMKEVLENQDKLDLRQGLVVNINKKNKIFNLQTSDGIIYSCSCVILCTGTFLGAKIYLGKYEKEAGRQGEICSKSLLDSLKKTGFKFGILRKYVAPMVDEKTIDINNLEKQSLLYEENPWILLYDDNSKKRRKLCSYITYINKSFIEYIYKNRKKIIFAGECNNLCERGRHSIEDRILDGEIVENQKIFIQPIGKVTNERYLQGLETALAEELQIAMLKKINGLERVEMTRPGYCIEHNYLLPLQLKNDLESREIKGIFFAGQVNGTNGYEESAAQGIIAGINASRKSKGINSIDKKL